MHETGLVRDLIRHVEQAAAAEGAARVSGVAVWLGALSHLSAAHFRDHFEIESRGGVAEGAVLAITQSRDLADPDAQRLRLESLDLEM